MKDLREVPCGDKVKLEHYDLVKYFNGNYLEVPWGFVFSNGEGFFRLDERTQYNIRYPNPRNRRIPNFEHLLSFQEPLNTAPRNYLTESMFMEDLLHRFDTPVQPEVKKKYIEEAKSFSRMPPINSRAGQEIDGIAVPEKLYHAAMVIKVVPDDNIYRNNYTNLLRTNTYVPNEYVYMSTERGMAAANASNLIGHVDLRNRLEQIGMQTNNPVLSMANLILILTVNGHTLADYADIYRDPESLYPLNHHEWDKNFMSLGVPGIAIEKIEFFEHVYFPRVGSNFPTFYR